MKTQKSTALVGIFTVFAVLGLVFAACSNPSGGDTTVTVTGVTLGISSKTLFEDESFTLTPTVEPSDATNKAVSWSSSDASKATVADGVVTAVAAGDATITVTTVDGGFTAICVVTVKLVPTSIEITTPPDKTLYKIGEELDLDGLVVSASYEGEYPDDEIDIESLEINGFDNTQVGEQELTITYGSKTTTFVITVRPFTSISEISEYLSGQIVQTGTVDDPIILPIQLDLGDMIQAGSGWRQLLEAIDAAGKFVDIDLSNCIMTGTEFTTGNSHDSMPDGLDKIASISLPDAVTCIYDYAFFRCANLALISLPAGVTSIGNFAFHNCANLALTELPVGLKSIGNGAFFECINLALTELPEGLESIGYSAFFECINLALTELPEGLESIGYRAFSSCRKISLTSLPSGLTEIGPGTFGICTNLALTSLPDGLTEIGDYAFDSCTMLAEITMPDTLLSIGNGAFGGCWDLSLVICLAITPPTLGTNVFFGNDDLRIEVPLGSVAAYKAAENWSDYSDRIFAIE